jgi:hypothetical protein
LIDVSQFDELFADQFVFGDVSVRPSGFIRNVSCALANCQHWQNVRFQRIAYHHEPFGIKFVAGEKDRLKPVTPNKHFLECHIFVVPERVVGVECDYVKHNFDKLGFAA